MKILLRKWEDKYYLWKDAKWNNGNYYVDGIEVMQINILAIENDERGKYVRCVNCGAILADDPKVIEKHFADEEAKKDCFKCGFMRMHGQTNATRDFTPNENGTYHVTQNYDANVSCNVTWSYVDINDKNINKNCVFYRCRNSGVRPIADIFMQYPGIFNKQLTVDFLKKKGFEYEKYNDRHGFIYDMKLRGTLKACVNELGIVDHFLIQYRYRSYEVYYSDKYDMLLYRDCNSYTQDIRSGVSQSKNDAVKGKISALYKEVNK